VREVAPRLFVAGGYNGTGNVVGAIAARGLVALALEGHSRLAALFDGAEA
jgi:glycine/D-amino acid oxidase-like deaminating enzyme